MKDPRQEAYRAECAAEAERGISRLDWQKPSFLFISNLNTNVTDHLLRVELAKWCPPSNVTIPSLDGLPLGFAKAKFPHGVILDRLLKDFNQREFHGQRINIVVDHEAKRYRQALNEANRQGNMQSNNHTFVRSPKKRTRAPESPTYSPASPARPVSDSDGPSPSKPKRPRCNSPSTSNHRHPDNRAYGHNMNDTNRNSGERQFSHSRRDSYHKPEPYHRSDSRNFASDRTRDYPGRRHDYHSRQSSAYNYQNQNRPYNGDSRRHRYETTYHHSYDGHRNRYGDRYYDHRRPDRRYGSGYRERRRSPRRYDTSYPRDYRTSNYPSRNIPKLRDTRQTSPHENGGVKEKEWEDEYRPAIVLEVVPRGTTARELLDAFREFHPKNAVTDGRGKCTMWFEENDDRNRAAAKSKFPFKGYMLRISPSSHLIGRRSVSVENPTSGRRDAHHTTRNGALTASSVQDRSSGSAKELARGSDDHWQRDARTDAVRKDSRTEHRGSRLLLSHRDLKGKLEDAATNPDSSDNAHPETSHRHSATWQRTENYLAGQMPRSEENSRSREHSHRESGRNGADGEQRDERYGFQREIATSRTPDVVPRHVASGGDMKKIGSGSPRTALGNVNRKNLPAGNTVSTSAQLKDFPNAVKAESHKRRGTGLGDDPRLSSKNLSVEEFADVLARYVYQTAKDTITAKRSAVQKSFVNQTVVKYTNAKKAREKERTKRTARASLNSARRSPKRNEGSASTAQKTAHLDLVETFLKPALQKQKKPPLPDRTDAIPIKRRTKRSRFGDVRLGDVSVIESAEMILLDSPEKEKKVHQSSDNHPPQPTPKRRRLVLPKSPDSSDSEHASADEKRQNSVDSVASSELFHYKESPSDHMKEESKKRENARSSLDAIINAEKPQIRHAKASSLKLSAASMAGGSIPHLVLTGRPPPSPAAPGPPGSALTSCEENTSQEPCSPVEIAKEISQKQKAGAQTKKKASRRKGQQIEKQRDETPDDEQFADLLLSLNQSVEKRNKPTKIEFLKECGLVEFDESEDETEILLSKRAVNVSKSTKAPSKGIEVTRQVAPIENIDPDTTERNVSDKVDHGQAPTKFEEEEPEEREPLERIGRCARSDVYVRADHTGQHRQRNVHSRTSTSTQTSRESRQESRVYRKGVSRINPKNDIISFNRLKQRRKQVSFGQSMIHGMGLYAKENIESGEFIIEYVGDLIRKVVADLREKKYTRQGMGDSYLFRLSGDWVIDATRRGGIARFINHSCDPNVYAKIISVVGEPKIVFYSKRSIKEGEELTYDYKFDFEAEDQKIPCLCKAATCRKYLN